MKFEKITQYIDKLDNPGEWVESQTFQNGKYYTTPYVGYTKEVHNFIDDTYDIVYGYPELSRYSDILEKSNIYWTKESMMSVDVNSLDVITILALLIGILRADRFSEGVLLEFLKQGIINNWLIRLKELDK